MREGVLRPSPSADSPIQFKKKITPDTQQNWFTYVVQLIITQGKKKGWVPCKATNNLNTFLIEKISGGEARICWFSNLENNSKYRLDTQPNSIIRVKSLVICHHWPETRGTADSTRALPTADARALDLTSLNGKVREVSQLCYKASPDQIF